MTEIAIWIAKVALLAVLALGGCWLIAEADGRRHSWFIMSLGLIILGLFLIALWRFSV